MDPDVEDTQEVYTEVVEKKSRQYGQGNAGRCKKSRAKKNYSKKRKSHAPKEENKKKKVDTKGEAPSTSHKKIEDVEKMEEGSEEMFDGYHLIHHDVLQSRCSFMP